MLWLPTKQTRKTIARIKRRRRRRRLARFLLFLFIFFGLKAASVPSSQALLVQVDQVTSSYQFDFVNWESLAVASEIGRRWHSPPLPDNQIGRQNLVQSFLEQEQRIRELEDELDRIYATSPDPGQEAQALEQKLTEIRSAQAEIIPQVETILSRQVETVLKDEGFTIAGQVFPPVALRFIDPPTSLILSPRDKIENQHSVELQPDLDNKVRSEIEATLDQRGDVSSYVTDVGGLASYPPMIIKYPSLIYLTEVIAHEWTHNYLLTFPTNIAWGYQTYPRLTTINETTADLVGKEISRQVITRFYPDWIDRLPPLDDTGQPAISKPSEFQLAMRRIRQEVDRLLAEGQIEEAEAFMEAERLKLVEKGYNLRKLNQAYFAFHGSYALSPASIDPIGPQLRQLRAVSPSLKAFVNRVGWINRYEDYLAWLAEAGIE